MDETEVVIKVDKVYKNFRLPHEKTSTIKGVFTTALKNVTQHQTIETQHALKDISFEIKKGEFFGIVGRNGSGKSTLLKMLAGIYQPTSGKIQVNGRLVPFIELGVGFNPELSGRDNVFINGALLGFSGDEVTGIYDKIVEFAELGEFMDQKLKNYSSGMQVRLAFSLATRAEADILLVDEVLAVGDADFQRKCFEYFKELKANKKTVVFVTHDMNAVREFCDRAMLIEENEIRYIGDPQDVAREYSLLFMGNQESELEKPQKNSGERWGNGVVKIKQTAVTLDKENISIKTNIAVIKALGCLIYGLHIIANDGVEVTAMNNRMIHTMDIVNLKPGQEIEFHWNVLNIFNDGKYSVTLTLIDDAGNTLDWLTKAATFTVKRAERSTTAVLPPVSVEYSIK